jgi:hypothetical protein
MNFWKMFKINVGCWIIASIMILAVYALFSGLWMFITSLTIPTIATYLVAAIVIVLIMTLIEYFATNWDNYI